MRGLQRHDVSRPKRLSRHHRAGVRRDHGRLRHFDYQKPVRRKRTFQAVKTVKAARTRLINRTTERILDVFDGKGMAGVACSDQVRIILEEVL